MRFQQSLTYYRVGDKVPEDLKVCWQCLGQHGFNCCPAFNANCRKWGENGHYSKYGAYNKVWHNKNTFWVHELNADRKEATIVNTLNIDDLLLITDFSIFNQCENNDGSVPNLTLGNQGKDNTGLIATGSIHKIMSMSLVSRLNLDIRTTKQVEVLHLLNGNLVKILSRASSTVYFKGKIFTFNVCADTWYIRLRNIR